METSNTRSIEASSPNPWARFLQCSSASFNLCFKPLSAQLQLGALVNEEDCCRLYRSYSYVSLLMIDKRLIQQPALVDIRLRSPRTHGLGRWFPRKLRRPRLRRRHTRTHQLRRNSNSHVRLPFIPPLPVPQIGHTNPIASRHPPTGKLALPAPRYDQYLGLLACIRRRHSLSLQLEKRNGTVRHELMRCERCTDLDAYNLC